MCEFQSLYFGDDGYVIKCSKCGHYQLAFASTMLTMTKEDFATLCHTVKIKMKEANGYSNHPAKCVVIPAASKSTYLLLTKKEAQRLDEILEEADNEEKALEMMSLFHQ